MVGPLAIDASRHCATGKGVSALSGFTPSVRAGSPGQPCRVAGDPKGAIFRQGDDLARASPVAQQ